MKIVVGNHKAYLDSDTMDKFLLDIGALNSNNVIKGDSYYMNLLMILTLKLNNY